MSSVNLRLQSLQIVANLLFMIPFNVPTTVGAEEQYLLEVLKSGKWCGRGPKTLALESLVKQKCHSKYAYFVTSCSSALEIGCLLADLKPGDEVILPSFGFVSSANAVVMTGAKPVFADINNQTWNVNLDSIKKVYSSKTKAIMTVHYAGSSAHTDEIRKFCKDKNLFLIEDAAQSLGAKRHDKPVGGTPWVTCFSLHETKNISCGEGGLILTDSEELAHRIEIIIEKGTNRQKFLRGQVDKYTWVDRGASYVASDFLAAIALAQMEKLDSITQKRQSIYKKIVNELSVFSTSQIDEAINGNKIYWQHIPDGIETNGHIAAFLVNTAKRDKVLKALKESGVAAMFHYVALHDSPYAKEHGFYEKDLQATRLVSESLVRLPIFFSMSDLQVLEVIRKTKEVLEQI